MNAESLLEEEKKDPDTMNRPDIDGEAAAPLSPPSSIVLSPSKQRAKAAGSAGLSELSKQLRILQAKNEAQSVEVNRLERQLRILAELQGINVADLRKALEDACANEAFGELQHRVAKLRAELEAATLAKQKELQEQGGTVGPHIANLELRVGELEEVEEKNQREIHHLYEQLRHERARATRLEAEGAQHKQDAQDYLERLNKEIAKGNRLEATFQEQLQQHQLEQARKMQEMAKLAKEAGQRSAKDSGIDANGSPTSSNDGKTSGGAEDSLESLGKSVMDAANSSSRNTRNFSPEMAAEYESMVNLLKEKDDALRRAEERLKAEEEKLAKLLREQDGQTREVQLNSQVEKDKMELTIKELKDADSQSLLRLAQFKARFHVQDERITDMEQQLSSLYTAFGLIKEERDVEDMKRAALQCNLNEADEEMARQVEHVEKKRNQSQRNPMQSERGPNEAGSPWRNVSSSNSSAGTPTTAAAGIPQAIQTPRTVVSTPGMASPVATPQRLETPPASVTAQPYVVTPQRTPGTWQLVFPSPDATQTRSFPSTPSTGGKNGLLIKGVLLVKSKSVMRKWKSKFCKLYLQRNHYQWDMEGKSYTLGTGISSVEFDPNYPLSFTVYTNPYDAMAPVIHAAASSEDDYHRWMSALTTATTGRIDDASAFDRTPQQSLEAATPRHSSAESVVSGLSVEEREAADLERALRLSQTMT